MSAGKVCVRIALGGRAAPHGRALIKAAAAILVSEDNRSLLGLQHGQRLFREAGFLLVLGSRHAIRASLIKRLLEAPE